MRYYNPVHGLELEPDINTGDRNNENGIMFLALYIMLYQFRQEFDKEDNPFRLFLEVITNIEVVPGLYDRGALDEAKDGDQRRTISHDNISSISGCSRLLYDMSKVLDFHQHRDIAEYGLRHGFVYNNRQVGLRAPMNPGNYSMWCALGNKALLIQLLFLPIYLINTIICLRKPAGETSGRLLTFLELYPLRKHWFWGKLYKRVLKSYVETYGNQPLLRITEIYFKDANHPVRLAAAGFDYDK